MAGKIGKLVGGASLLLLVCSVLSPSALRAVAEVVPSGGPKPISYQPPKEQVRAEIKWVKPICVEKDRYIGWPTVCRLANGDILAVFSGDRDWHVCPGGKVVCVYGRRFADPGFGEFACISDDGGKTWDVANEIALAPSHCGDLGYPASCILANGDILTVFYQQLAPDEKPCLMATRWRVRQ